MRRQFLPNRRASLNLSIETIVIVVIAFVVLGLGLGFVRNQIKDISETSSSVQEQIRQQVLEDLRTGNKKLSFPATSLSINKGESTDIVIGVKNTKSAGTLSYRIDIMTTCQRGDEPCAESYDDVSFFYDRVSIYELAVTDASVHPIKITADGDKGVYLVKLTIIDTTDGSVYDTKTFFVSII